MRIGVKVRVRSSRNDVVKNGDGTYTVFLKSAPAEGKANEELIEILSEKFDVNTNAIIVIASEAKQSIF